MIAEIQTCCDDYDDFPTHSATVLLMLSTCNVNMHCERSF